MLMLLTTGAGVGSSLLSFGFAGVLATLGARL